MEKREKVAKRINKIATDLNNDSLEYNILKTKLDVPEDQSVLSKEEREEVKAKMKEINDRRKDGMKTIADLFENTYWGSGTSGKKKVMGRGRIS